MSRVLPVCVVRTQDNALKFFDEHDPIVAKAGGHVTVNLNLDRQVVSLRLCSRCGVAYVDSEVIRHAKPKLVPPLPKDSDDDKPPPTSH